MTGAISNTLNIQPSGFFFFFFGDWVGIRGGLGGEGVMSVRLINS